MAEADRKTPGCGGYRRSNNFATSYLGKGRLVYVKGRLQRRQWQATDGSTRRTVEIVANRLQALSSKSASEAPKA